VATTTVVPATPTALSPEGILGFFAADETGNSDIYRINADGSGRVNLTQHPADDYGLVWSPDGAQIAFWSNRDGQGRIYVMQADGTGVTPVDNTGPLDIPADWSADGQYLLLQSNQEVNTEIVAIKLDGSGRVNLTQDPAEDSMPAWSPDNGKIAFASTRDSVPGAFIPQIYLMNSDASEVVQITHFPGGATNPIWAPNGEEIAFSVTNETGSGNDVYVMGADGSQSQKLSDDFRWSYPGSWSPDGRAIAVVAPEDGEIALFTREGNIVATLPIRSWTARWRPANELISSVSDPAPTPTAEATSSPPLALINGTLIDGTGAEPVENAVLLLEGNRILAVGPAGDVTIPPTAQIIDVQGATILPGFVNAHVHGAMGDNLAAWARAGVTTVRDLGATTLFPLRNWDQWVEQADERPAPVLFYYHDATLDRPQYARVVAAGPIVTVPGGYPIPVWGPDIALTVSSPEDAGRKIETLLAAGADVIKISIESGPRLSVEEVEAIVATAHEHSVPVTAHVSARSQLAMGVAAGIDDAAHMPVTELSDELIAQLVADDVYIVPTLAVLKAYGRSGSSLTNLRHFVEAGGKVALGDDYGNPGSQLGMPMPEIELMQAAGMAPMQIIIAATQHGAHVCNLEEELGTLEVGKVADVLVVDGDPLQDIHALESVRLVIRDGVVIYTQ
jgi:imidazolonepropionase-like amidohydrolase